MKTAPHCLLGRFAGRALRVLERHLNRAPALGIYSETLAKSARQFIDVYERASAFEAAGEPLSMRLAILARCGGVPRIPRKPGAS